jgi:hypothetical protein
MSLRNDIPNAEVFITVKTYPILSHKYGELVCTAGICNGKLIRIYPIRFRSLNGYQKYAKFQWIRLNLKHRGNKDPRLESYSPNGDITLGAKIGAGPDGWAARMRIINQLTMHDNVAELIKLAKAKPFPSLAALRPKKILAFTIEDTARDWTEEQKAYFHQLDLFEEEREPPEKIPYTYSYRFTTEDGKERKLMIEDWEIGALYRNCLQRCDGDEAAANHMVRQKYETFAKNPNLFFFVGTTLKHHWQSPNPFIIIGVVPSLADIRMRQGELFPGMP